MPIWADASKSILITVTVQRLNTQLRLGIFYAFKIDIALVQSGLQDVSQQCQGNIPIIAHSYNASLDSISIL